MKSEFCIRQIDGSVKIIDTTKELEGRNILDIVQPERSKREDSECMHQLCLVCGIKILPLEETSMIGQKHLRCGALNTTVTP